MKTSRIFGLAVVLLVAGALVSCRGGKKKTGVTKTEIVFGQWSPQTGPAALWGSVARGTACYFDMINAEGGINGRKLKLIIRDDGYNPARTVTAVREMAERKNVFGFIGGIGTATGMAVKQYLAKKKLPWVSPGSGSSKWSVPPQRYVFSMMPRYEDEAALLTRYLATTMKKEKIAFFYQNDDYGKEGLHGAQKALKKLGKSLVAEVSVEVTDTNLASHVLKLKNAQADAVILWLLPKHAAITLGTAAKLGFKPQWATGVTLSDVPLMHKITKGLWNDTVFTAFFQLPDSGTPLMKKYRAAFDKYGKARDANDRWGIFFMAGFLYAEPAVEALRRCGKDVTREKFVNELEKLKDWKGGLSKSVTFGPKERQGIKSVFMAKAQGGKAVKLSDWLTLD